MTDLTPAAIQRIAQLLQSNPPNYFPGQSQGSSPGAGLPLGPVSGVLPMALQMSGGLPAGLLPMAGKALGIK
jgi:hypothetical protein